MSYSAPHLSTDTKQRTTRSGFFWIPGETITTSGGTVSRGPLYVAWECPVEVTREYPLVLIHGGGGQGTDWIGTPDGRPGWAKDFVDAGFAVYVVDRPGHGRSPYHPDIMGQAGPPFPFEVAQSLFAPKDDVAMTHDQWVWGRGINDHEMAQMYSGMGFLMENLATQQDLDGDRLAKLLDVIGPAILVSHSAGAPGGWLAANRRPENVKGIVAVEPMGPPFAEFPGAGFLEYGISFAPVITNPPLLSAADLRATPSRYSVVGLKDLPIAVVTGGASVNAHGGPPMVEFLKSVGGDAFLLHLPDYAFTGNGHGLIFEKNSSETIVPVIDWVASL